MSRPIDLSLETDLTTALDRLVAGNLTGVERRALLVKLESSPDGWRRCALAFLEDQAWRTALGQPPVLEAMPIRAKSIRRHRWPLVVGRYALAAGLIGLFALARFRQGVREAERSAPIEVTKHKPEKTKTPALPDLEPGQPVGWVGLAQPDDGESPPRPVPILAATAANQQWLQAQPATIPDYVRAIWERRGYQVEENHRLVELGLQDGRPVGIPIDEVSFNYVGQRPL